MNVDLLMGFDEYEKFKRPTPYFFIIRNKKQVLYYFGARHSYDPRNDQFTTLKNFWDNFINETRGQNCIVFVEGGKRPVMNSEEEAIKVGGEAHFVTFLATKRNIGTISPEPDPTREREELLKQFPREKIAYYYFARAVDQWHRRNQKSDFKTYIQQYLERDQGVSQWPDFDFSLENMKLIHKNLFGTDFNELDAEFFSKIVNPSLTVSLINDVARSCGGFREIEILKEIEHFWNDGKNIFIVYGQTHAVIQEPVLKTLPLN